MADLSDLEEAFEELLEAKAEVSPGGKEFVVIDGRRHEAIVESISLTDIIVPGGTTEGDTFKAQCRFREFTRKPETGAPAKCRGRTLEVIECADTNRVTMEITIGSLSSYDR